MRQLTYGSVSIGLYETLKKQTKTILPPPHYGLLAGISAFIGAFLGSSSDIGNIRMQNDGSLPLHLRRNYRHIFDGVETMATLILLEQHKRLYRTFKEKTDIRKISL
ncbi:hypothetical protein ACN38_g12263 [Penicillium nordicum]|uniref:Uncharacterized protein n=1 Tax=Penicillium nordicum TaxID=229535 RepID=A0A0M8NYV1_9EURO|nr:hypothetical protein ACN38_g12263 [Penicillium nordicum]